MLRADLLGAWSHWITPIFEPRRFDTRFFVAVLPEGQAVGELARESDRALWAPLSKVLEAVESGASGMLPPTFFTCKEIAGLAASEVLGGGGEAHRTSRSSPSSSRSTESCSSRATRRSGMTATKVTERASVLRCDNPGMMTLEGTNTWILREGSGRAVRDRSGP